MPAKTELGCKSFTNPKKFTFKNTQREKDRHRENKNKSFLLCNKHLIQLKKNYKYYCYFYTEI